MFAVVSRWPLRVRLAALASLGFLIGLALGLASHGLSAWWMAVLTGVGTAIVAVSLALAVGPDAKTSNRRRLLVALCAVGISSAASVWLITTSWPGAALCALIMIPLGLGLHSAAAEIMRAAEVVDLSGRDPITGLRNHAGLLAVADPGGPVVVVELPTYDDLVRHLGAEQASDALASVAARLEVVAGPRSLVARMSGSTFIIVTSPMASVSQIGDAVADALLAPHSFANAAMTLRAHVGISRAGAPLQERIRCAMVAAWVAQENEQPLMVYQAGADPFGPERVRFIEALRQALLHNEIGVAFQPKVDADTGLLVGAETLIRWQRSTGLVSAYELITAARLHGMLPLVRRTVLRHAVLAASALHRSGHSVPIAVNLSPVDLEDPTLVSEFASAMRGANLPSGYLVAEVTEETFTRSGGLAVRTLEGLRECGVKVSLDDFGTGYSNLARLRELPLDEVKLDASLVADVVDSMQARAVIAATVAMSHALGLTVVVEGVETGEQRAIVTGLGADVIQGWHTGPPDSLESLVTRATLDSRVAQGIES